MADSYTIYREPNVYTTVTRVVPVVPVRPVDMYPLVIGTGATENQYTDVSVLAVTNIPETEGADNKANIKDYTIEQPNATVQEVYIMSEWGEKITLVQGENESTGSYHLETNESGYTTIHWNAQPAEGDEHPLPQAGQYFYLTYVASAGADRFTLQRFTDPLEVEDFYGSARVEIAEITKDGTTTPATSIDNNVSLGASLVLRGGSPVVYTLQLPQSRETLDGMSANELAMAYYEALSENVVDLDGERIWRICPADDFEDGQTPGKSTAIIKAIRRFVNEMSLPEERSEKFGTINNVSVQGENIPYSSTNTDEVSLYSSMQNFVNNFGGYRFQTFYPNSGTLRFDDGTEMDVGGAMIGCVYSGFEQTMERKSQSTTNSVIPAGILNLNTIKLRRTQKNEIAAMGVTLLTQTTPYGAITVRDALSMDRSSYQVDDPCITMAVDFFAKGLREELRPYIGKHSITPDTISKIRAATDVYISNQIEAGIILSGSITSLNQDASNPQRLMMGLRVGVMYPLKQIDVNIVLD